MAENKAKRGSGAAFLAAAKQYLDPVAAGISQIQTQRQQELRKKRKRGYEYDNDVSVLNLKKLHLDGFGINQVFEQTRKIVEAAGDVAASQFRKLFGDVSER